MKVVIHGLGKQAEFTHYCFTHDSPYEVVAFCVDAAYLPADGPSTFLGLPVVSFEELTASYPPAAYVLHIAVGQNSGRRRLYDAAKARGYGFASYVSSRAQTWPDLITGEHVFIDPVSCIHPYVTVGDNTMLVGVRIGHHSVIGRHVTISGCTMGGNVTVGDGTFIGMGTVINEDMTIGSSNIIGSGCLISRSTADNAVYAMPGTRPRQVSADRIALFKK